MLTELATARATVLGHTIFFRFATKRASAGQLPVVLVHGLGTSSLYMVPTARRLAAQGAVYAPDLPGFGLSSKPSNALGLGELAEVLAEWMTAVGLPRAAMAGNSLGCQIIGEFGVRYPHRLDRAILQGPTMDAYARRAPQQFYRFMLDLPREKAPEYFINSYDYWRCGLRRGLQTFRMALADRLEDKLPALTVPVMVVRGNRDPIVSERWAKELAARLTNGRLVTIRGAHTPNFSQPDAFAGVVRAFLGPGYH